MAGRVGVGLVAVFVASCLAPAARPPRGGTESPELQAILRHSLVDNILGGQADDFLEQVREAAPQVSSARWPDIEFAVRREFEPGRMRSDVAAVMYAESLPIILEELLALLENGAIARVTEIQASYAPPESLQEYVAASERAPPPQTRVRLIARLTEVQGAGEFYLLLDEAAREAANGVAHTLSDAPVDFVPLDERAFSEQVQQGYNFAIWSFLHRYRPVQDDMVEQVIAEYETEAGRWYVETYSVALAEAIRRAGVRVEEQLR